MVHTSHDGLPSIDGVLLMNKSDRSRPLDARPGHGNDSIHAGPWGDVIRVPARPGDDLLYISRRAQKHYKIRNCERISHKTLGR